MKPLRMKWRSGRPLPPSFMRRQTSLNWLPGPDIWHIATFEAHLLHQHFVHSKSSKLIATYCYGLIQWFDNVVQDCTITLCGVWGIYPATMYKLLWRYTGNHGATVARRCSQVAPIINKAFEMIVMPWYWTLDRWYKHKDEIIGFRVRKGEGLGS